jgi:uncharacterized protein with gpF-like domain
MQRALVTTCLLAAAVLLATQAAAADKDAKYYQARFDRISRVIADLKSADVGDELGQDIEVMRTWISQAQAYLAADKLDEVQPLLERIVAQVEFVRAKLKRIEAEQAAAAAEDDADEAEAAAEKTAAAAEAAEEKYQELEAKGL